MCHTVILTLFRKDFKLQIIRESARKSIPKESSLFVQKMKCEVVLLSISLIFDFAVHFYLYFLLVNTSKQKDNVWPYGMFSFA